MLEDADQRAQLHAELARKEVPYPQNMLALVRSFPSLRAYPSPNVNSFDAVHFHKWARGAHATSGSIHAARFVLDVWNGAGGRWKIGRFSVRDAFGTWDEAHVRAFRAYCEHPFFP